MNEDWTAGPLRSVDGGPKLAAMRSQLADMTRRAAGLRDEVARGTRSEALLARIEDALSEGYSVALAGDARSMRAEERLHAIVSDPSVPVRGATLRTIAREHATLEAEIVALRRALAELRRERDRLLAASPAPSA